MTDHGSVIAAPVGPGAPPPGRGAGRPVRRSAAELLAGASSREPLETGDGKSGATLEAVTIDGHRFVLKHVGPSDDWVARGTGDVSCRSVQVWASGLLDELPDEIDHAVVAAAHDPASGQGALLLRHVGSWLVPPGDTRLPYEQHRRFLDHMAALHARFWGFADGVGLTALEARFLLFGPEVVAAERARGDLPGPLPLVPQGWGRLRELAPDAAAIVDRVHAAPARLADPLRATPSTLLHGDWKAGNLGTGPDGRTILLDWALPGAGPGCVDLGWYLAINAARLPESKLDAIAAYRAALHRHGIDTDGWWEPQLDLGLLAAFVMLGWEKALGDAEELDWWLDRVREAARWLR